MKLELSGGSATNLFKAVNAARATEPMRLALTGILWESSGGVHAFTATDSFRMHRITVKESSQQHSIEYVLSGDVVKAVQNCAKSVGKDGKVTLETETMGDYNTHCLVSGVVKERVISQVVVETLNVEYPKCSSFFDGPTEIELPALFNGKYLGDLIDAATLWAGKNGVISVDSLHSGKPGRVGSTNFDGVFCGIIMPSRGGK